MGPATAAAQLPLAAGAAAADRLESCVPPPLLLLSSLWLQAQPRQLGDWNNRHCP